jgi:biopolymer transport protein ExbB
MDLLWSAIDYLAQGGWIMLPLALCSLIMWTLISERLYTLRCLTQNDIELPDAILALQTAQRSDLPGSQRTQTVEPQCDHLPTNRTRSQGDRIAANARGLRAQGYRLASNARGLRAQLIRSFLLERTGYSQLDKEILQACAHRLRPNLDRFLGAIAVLAAIAPLLGLLGTVLGMIETFTVLSIFGTGNAKALAGGISIALITTQSGLLIAIPGLFLSSALDRRASKLQQRLHETASVLARHVQEGSIT